jgi:hypothetical protein
MTIGSEALVDNFFAALPIAGRSGHGLAAGRSAFRLDEAAGSRRFERIGIGVRIR